MLDSKRHPTAIRTVAVLIAILLAIPACGWKILRLGGQVLHSFDTANPVIIFHPMTSSTTSKLITSYSIHPTNDADHATLEPTCGITAPDKQIELTIEYQSLDGNVHTASILSSDSSKVIPLKTGDTAKLVISFKSTLRVGAVGWASLNGQPKALCWTQSFGGTMGPDDSVLSNPTSESTHDLVATEFEKSLFLLVKFD